MMDPPSAAPLVVTTWRPSEKPARKDSQHVHQTKYETAFHLRSYESQPENPECCREYQDLSRENDKVRKPAIFQHPIAKYAKAAQQIRFEYIDDMQQRESGN